MTTCYRKKATNVEQEYDDLDDTCWKIIGVRESCGRERPTLNGPPSWWNMIQFSHRSNYSYFGVSFISLLLYPGFPFESSQFFLFFFFCLSLPNLFPSDRLWGGRNGQSQTKFK